MSSGTKLADAYVQIIPSAKGIKGKITEELGGEANSAGKSAGLSIASAIKGAIVAAGIGTALKSAINEGAALQQSVGGIETLFKDSADVVIANAKNAYKTAGMSANAYMESVTSFSASLLQGLAGDTGKAASVADMALTDMSDNANKMGTSMELIQNAYQGFAKQNYTMLDNLKLGYGGTKTEMQRLLADTQKLTGVKYDINNLSDVYEAIHVIQEEMGITGTTAKEAASTFTGSLDSMKAAFKNVLGNLSLGEDIGPSLNALRDTISTFLFNNLAPMIGNVLKSLPEIVEGMGYMVYGFLNQLGSHSDEIIQGGVEIIGQLVTGIIGSLPYLAESVICIGKAIGDAIINTDWIAVITEFLSDLGGAISLGIGECFGGGDVTMAMTDSIIKVLPTIVQTIQDAFFTIWETVGKPIFDTLVGVFQYIADNWDTISGGIQEAFQLLWDVINVIWTEIGVPIFETIERLLGTVKDAFAERMPAIQEFVGNCFSDIKVFWEENLKPCFEAIGDFIKNVLAPVFESIFKGFIGPLIDTVFTFVKSLWEGTLKPVFTGITDFLTGVFTLNFKQAWEGIKSIFTGIINGIITGIEGFVNGCISAINGLIGGINLLIGKAGDLIGLELAIPEIPTITIPKLLRGGVLERGQIGLLEGSGAEAVVPLENNSKWISKVASDLNSATGKNDVLQKILDILISMRDDMPEEFAEIIAQMKFVLNEREFGRFVKAVS